MYVIGVLSMFDYTRSGYQARISPKDAAGNDVQNELGVLKIYLHS